MATGEFIHLIHEGKTFEDQVVYLSGHTYLDCTFRRCTIVIRDRLVPQVSNCKIEACVWHLDLLITDFREWTEFLDGMGMKIMQSLPRPLGAKN